ncbi:hypothetical protein Bbelb_240430 [Branchiostoma belcheri]|nr:hypothetical protein Bbelb_240430 [Branchiostoma belcheri]
MGRKLRNVLIFLLIILKEPSMQEAQCLCEPPSPLLRLVLRDNQITTINFGLSPNLPKLDELYLEHNQITTIHSGALIANLPQIKRFYLYNNQLQELRMEDNQITTIDSGTFENLSLLKSLKLENNNMSVIPLSVFCLFTSTVKIRLTGNPWQCDCRMAPVRLFPAFNDQIICAQPAKVGGQELANVDLKELVCEEQRIPPLTGNSCLATESTSSVGNTESNASPSVFKHTGAGSTANPAENTNKTEARLTLPLAITSDQPESAPNFPQPATVTQIGDIQVISHNSHYHWYFKHNAAPLISDPAGNTGATLTSQLAITSDKPESAPSFPVLPRIRSIGGSVAGAVLIGTFLVVIWNKRRTRNPPLGPNPGVIGTNSNTGVSVMASDQDHQYEDIDNHQDQLGHRRSQANIQSLTVGNLSHDRVQAALSPNPMYYVGVRAPPKKTTSTEITTGHYQTGQGQFQTITASNTNTTATVMTSGHDQTWKGQSETITASNTNTTATVMVIVHDQIGEDQSETITTSNTNTAASVMTSGHDQRGQGQSETITASNTNTTATVMTSGHDQTGQGQSQAITESLDVSNLSYGTGPTFSQQHFLYKAVTQSRTITNTNVVMISGHDQTGQGQYQTITESLDARNLSYGTGPTVSQQHSVYKDVDQSQTITSIATVMTSGHDQTGQGQYQAINESLDARNLSYGTAELRSLMEDRDEWRRGTHCLPC